LSTYWFYECLDHTPPLSAREEFTQHTGDRHYLRAIEMLASRPVELVERYFAEAHLLSDVERSDLYFTENATRFLISHPTCRIDFVNEHGDRTDPHQPTADTRPI
jgi:hypothetical protein